MRGILCVCVSWCVGATRQPTLVMPPSAISLWGRADRPLHTRGGDDGRRIEEVPYILFFGQWAHPQSNRITADSQPKTPWGGQTALCPFPLHTHTHASLTHTDYTQSTSTRQLLLCFWLKNLSIKGWDMMFARFFTKFQCQNSSPYSPCEPGNGFLVNRLIYALRISVIVVIQTTVMC